MLGDPTELMKLNCSEADPASNALDDEFVSGLCNSYGNKDGFSNFIGNVTDFLDISLFELLDAFNTTELIKLTTQSNVDEAFKTIENELNIVYNSYIDIYIYLFK